MTEMNAKEMAKLAMEALEEKKAEDISVIDISRVSVLADFFLIASGNNRNQVQALADNVEEKLGRAGVSPRQVEGYNTANWVLMDYGDIIVGRMGVPDKATGINTISLIVNGYNEKISALCGKLGRIEDVNVKSAVMTVDDDEK